MITINTVTENGHTEDYTTEFAQYLDVSMCSKTIRFELSDGMEKFDVNKKNNIAFELSNETAIRVARLILFSQKLNL